VLNFLNEFMSDTLGLLWRVFGRSDPWTRQRVRGGGAR
jgi:hypothetical protein